MLLVHKPTAIAMSSPAAYSHRRYPSAPVVVQPTRIPGLLSLSKPQRPSPPVSRQQPNQHRPSPRAQQKSTKPSSVVRAQVLTPAAEIKPTVAPVTPSPQPRGRAQAKLAKDKAEARSASQSSLRGKHGRQPSPPVQQQHLHQISSQAEAPIKSTNLFDPFLDSTPSSPTLTSHPSGKLAVRRKQQHTSPSPALSKAIPVPSSTRSHPPTVARSDPTPSHINQRPRPLPKRSSTLLDFPVCDDMNETATFEAPLTPRRLYDNGPQTAPISARSPGAFPFAIMASPPPSPVSPKKHRKHRRTPSEGVFHMSSDEELSSGPGGVVLNPSVQALFGLASTPAKTSPSPFVTPSRVIPRTRESSPSYGSLESISDTEASEKAGYFASSMFQNSPSPDELPDPLLL